jgi:(p)ppGpp synthase/HD superfamily hydrolase
VVKKARGETNLMPLFFQGWKPRSKTFRQEDFRKGIHNWNGLSGRARTVAPRRRALMMELSSRFEEALVFTTRLHSSRPRKGTDVPYVAHLLSVAGIAMDHGATEVEAIAALLHGADEDQGGSKTWEEIRRRFGDAAVDIVNGCTDAEVIPEPVWRVRKKAYLSHLPGASSSVQLVSTADKLNNARAILRDYRIIGEDLWGQFNGGREGILWYYRALVSASVPVPQPRSSTSSTGL